MRRVLALSVLALISAALTAPALAHAAYEGSDPDNGSTVSEPPSRVIADFTERLSADNSKLSIFDPCGAQVDGGDSLIANDRMTVSMSANKRGTYVVRFEALSDVDGHLTQGQFSFTSSGGEPCPEAGGEEEGQEEDASDPDTGERERETGSSTTQRPRTGANRTSETREQEATRTAAMRSNDRGKEGIGLTGPGSNDPGIAAPADAVDRGATETSIWDGIPIGDFLIALGVAALIGAAGGRIYAGIIGPRR